MSTERKQIRLAVENSKESLNSDSFIKINIDDSERLLPPGALTKVVDAAERFDFERQRSTYYRIIGTMNILASNPLFNLDDSGAYLDLYTWRGFNYVNQSGDYRFIDPIYPDVIKKYLKENNGWFGYYDPDVTKAGFCNYFDMEPKRERFSFIQDIDPYRNPIGQPVKNWELTITYPATSYSGHTMVNGGLLLVDVQPAVVSTRQMSALSAGCLHNLAIGDLVRISGTNGYDGDHLIVRTGLDNGDLKGYYFVIDIPTSPFNTIGQPSRMKKVVNNKESLYYFRIFRKIKTRNTPVIETDDYETYRLAFSENSYQDDITQFVFNEDIDVSDLVDNLGRPLTELYLTVIKTNSNGLFTQVKSGIELPFIPQLNTSNTSNPHLLDIPVINKIHNSTILPFPSHTPLESNVTINNNNNINNNNDYYGDLVEYNEAELREHILAHVSHRFNTVNRETNPSMTYTTIPANPFTTPNTPPTTVTTILGPRQEGYFYKAHHLIRIKQLSAYIEQGDANSSGIPTYAVALGDGTSLWRDILDIGFNQVDGTALNYPFLNGCHYRYDNYCFYVRRQDPFDNWDLYYSTFPSDPVGESITDKFTINSAENVC
jgi:hypothetical protein